MFAAFWGGGAGSEVLSTEEMRSKHPRTSLKPQGEKQASGLAELWAQGWGERKEALLAPSGREGLVSASDTEEVKGQGRPHTWEVERTESLSQAGKASTPAHVVQICGLGQPPASSSAQPHSSARASAHRNTHQAGAGLASAYSSNTCLFFRVDTDL